MRLRRTMGLVVGGGAACALLGGCLERQLSVTSEPSGAVVYANDVELGRTPLEASFTYYGSYDVRVQMEGYEPIQRRVVARAPIYEYPPLDLLAVGSPLTIDHTVHWHFKMEPAREARQSSDELERGMLERARVLRDEIR